MRAGALALAVLFAPLQDPPPHLSCRERCSDGEARSVAHCVSVHRDDHAARTACVRDAQGRGAACRIRCAVELR